MRRALRTQEPAAEGKRRAVQGDQAAVDALAVKLRTRSGANTSLSPPGPRETDLATRAATQREAAAAGGAATTQTVGASAEEAAPAVAEVGGSAVEDKAGKTRVELAANTPIGPGAGKVAAVAGAAAAATVAMRSSAAATLIVGAQHAAPAAHVSAATRPRTEETATEIGAAAAAALAMPGRGAARGGKERQELRHSLVPGASTVNFRVAAAEAGATAAAATEGDHGGPAWPSNWASMSKRSRKHYIARNRPHRD